MVKLLYSDSDSALALRIRGDLEANGILVDDSGVVVAVLSPKALLDKKLESGIYTALDQHQHIIPVLAQPVNLPGIIGNLETLDFSSTYDSQALIAQVERLSAPDAPPPLTTLTPTKRASNRQVGVIMGVLVAIIFVISLIAIGSGTIQAPENEFASVETQIILTRNYYIDEALPRTTEQAAEFETTLEHVPGSAVPQLILTATAISGGVEASFVPRSTDEATNFAATVKAVSTIVQDSLREQATAAAGGN